MIRRVVRLAVLALVVARVLRAIRRLRGGPPEEMRL
jgi:hypothetical protein